MDHCRSANDLERMGPISIRKAEAWRLSIPMHEPFRISSGEVSSKDAIIVRLSDGPYFGWGESSAMPGAFYSAETPDTCENELVNHILPALVGQSYPTMLALEAALAEWTSSRFVRVAIETAAWELLARKRHQSLRQLFGLPDRPIPSGLAVGLYDTDEQLHEAVNRYRVRDYQRLKIKIKRGHDLRLVRSVRDWFGNIPLFVDANADYTLDDLDVFREMDRYGLMMFEQPFARADFEGSARLHRAGANADLLRRKRRDASRHPASCGPQCVQHREYQAAARRRLPRSNAHCRVLRAAQDRPCGWVRCRS